MESAIKVASVVERKQEDLPRYVVVPAKQIDRWRLAGTTTIDIMIYGEPVARRTIKQWDQDRWFVSITEQDCRKLGIDTGSTIELTLRRAPEEFPAELAQLLASNAEAKAVWDGLTRSQQRMIRDDVGAAKQGATRARRAAKALLGR